MPLIGGGQGLPFDVRTVGERFMFEREKTGLSRAELAGTCEYSSEQVRRVEIGQQAPGARLLAALAEAGGDLRAILLGAGNEQPLSHWDAVAAAKYRDDVRREAREYARLRSDRKKKVLTDDEADLVEAYRELSKLQREQVLPALRAMFSGVGSDPSSSVTVVATGNANAAGRDQFIGTPPRKKS